MFQVSYRRVNGAGENVLFSRVKRETGANPVRSRHCDKGVYYPVLCES